MQPIVSIHLFGGFHFTVGGTPLTTLNAPHLQSLLAYVLLHRDAPQSRQHLAFLLWPDSSEVQAQSNLRTLLRRLRQAWPAFDDCLQVDKRTIQWRSDAPLMLDVEAFERALERAQSAGGPAELEQALSLYGGDLLPHCYDDWILPERERLRQKFLHALTQLVQGLEAQRDYNTALVYAQRLLQLDPLQETTYQILMRLHAAHGGRVNVVRAFRQCETVLAQELGVEPSSETRDLLAQLQQAAPIAIAAHLPPPATNNLPVPLTSFIGRVREMTAVKQSLHTTRLLTLTGVGGSGKSRLALQVCRDVALERLYADGVWWVELAALTDPTLIPPVIASVLGIFEQPGRALIETLADTLKGKHLLLVLDNCEHLIQSCASFASILLRASVGLQMLATSREALGIAGETNYAVPPLALPASVDAENWQAVAESDASRLFIERAQAVLPTFNLTQQNATALARVCERLDGIPLAIELAAARVKVLLVEQIAARLDDRFSLLTTGDRTAPPRHQKLRALIDWSYDLLDEDERLLLRRLSVFAGGWTLAAMEAVCADEGIEASDMLDLLSRLVDKSLVVVDAIRVGEGVRYRLLETIRQYATQKLRDSAEWHKVHARHVHYFLGLAEEAEPQLFGTQQTVWLGWLEAEHDNLRASLEWATASGLLEQLIRLSGALPFFWMAKGHITEGRVRLESALGAMHAGALPASLHAKALIGASELACIVGDHARATALATEGLTLYQSAGNSNGMANAYRCLAFLAECQGDYQLATELAEQGLALCRAIGDKHSAAYCLTILGRIARWQGSLSRAAALLEESLVLLREVGNDYSAANSLRGLALVYRLQANYERANALIRDSLTVMVDMGSSIGIVDGLDATAAVAYEQGNHWRSACLFAAVDALREALKVPRAHGPRADYERLVLSLNNRMEANDYLQARVRGRLLTLEQAIEYALKEE